MSERLVAAAAADNARSPIINLFSYNLITFVAFLLTMYLNALINIYYCTLTSLERWHLTFLRQQSMWRKLCIYMAFVVYATFSVACTISLCMRLDHWSLFVFVLPLFLTLMCAWLAFQLINTINLIHLMNKVNDCFLLLNESISISHANSFENSSNASNKSKYSSSSHKYNSNNNNRHSAMSQTSGLNNAAAGATGSVYFKSYSNN